MKKKLSDAYLYFKSSILQSKSIIYRKFTKSLKSKCSPADAKSKAFNEILVNLFFNICGIC